MVEIVHADIDRQVGTPIVGDAGEFDIAALRNPGHFVRARAQRRFQRRRLEIAAAPVGFRKNRHARNDQMQVARPFRGQFYLDDIIGGRARRHQIVEQQPVVRVAFGFQDIQRKRHIPRAQFRAVVETSFGPQQKRVGQLVCGYAHGPRHQAIHRIGLITRAAHQRIERRIHAGRAITLKDKHVERVERLEILVAARRFGLDRQRAAFGGERIDIGEMLEIRRLRQFAKGRKAMAFGFALGQSGPSRMGQGGKRKGRCAKLQRCAPGNFRQGSPRVSFQIRLGYRAFARQGKGPQRRAHFQ